MGKSWFLYIPEEHMFYYNPGSLERMLNKHGLEVTRRQRAFKPLSLNYSLFHLKEYNPLIYRVLSPFKTLLGERLADAPIPLYIGEMLVFGRCSAGTTLGP
jgi:hypothetical protein